MADHLITAMVVIRHRIIIITVTDRGMADIIHRVTPAVMVITADMAIMAVMAITAVTEVTTECLTDRREDLMGMDRVIITTIIITIMDRAITAIIMATEAAEEIIITRRSQRTGIQ